MLIHIEPTAEQLGRLTVRTRNAVLFEADSVQPFSTPHEIVLPEGVAEGDVEVTFVGISTGNQPVGAASVIKPFAPEPEPEPAPEPAPELPHYMPPKGSKKHATERDDRYTA